MRLLAVLLLLVSAAQPIRAVIFNFVKRRYVIFLVTDAMFDADYFAPLAVALILAGVAAGQYGILPLRSKQVVKRLRWFQHKVRHRRDAVPHRYRRDVTDDALDWLLQVTHLLEDAASRFEGLQEGNATLWNLHSPSPYL